MSGKFYIGNNYCHSIFRLLGCDEDALSYALGYLLSIDPSFCISFLKKIGVLKNKKYLYLEEKFQKYSVYLQQCSSGGRKDIVIETSDRYVRVVIEVKINDSVVGIKQLLKYTIGESQKERENLVKEWESYKYRHIVTLTSPELSNFVRSEIERKLKEEKDEKLSGIKLHCYQWYKVFELVNNRIKDIESDKIKTYIYEEFIRFFKEDYKMKYYDAEVFIKDLSKEFSPIYFEGHMYFHNDSDAPLYFAPYLTNAHKGNAGLQYISKVLYVERNFDIENKKMMEKLEKENPGDWEYWKKGIEMYKEMKEKKWWSEKIKKLYLLSEPMKFCESPILKKDIKRLKNEGKISFEIPRQIPSRYSLTFHQLFSAVDMLREKFIEKQ